MRCSRAPCRPPVCGSDPVFDDVAVLPIPLVHDPRRRSLVETRRHWQIRVFARGEETFRTLAQQGALNVQFWSRALATSILTPSVMTDGAFEVWMPWGCWRDDHWCSLVEPLWRAGVSVPGLDLVHHLH